MSNQRLLKAQVRHQKKEEGIELQMLKRARITNKNKQRKMMTVLTLTLSLGKKKGRQTTKNSLKTRKLKMTSKCG
jgi:hypothetical protein